MAEKEERIYIGFINPEGDACPVPYGKCNSLCDNCQGGITRQEAIERMAKAMFDWKGNGSRGDVPKEDVWENEKFCLENLAEAALDSLLWEDK